MPFCTQCGGQNPQGAKFCGHCGTKQIQLGTPDSPITYVPSPSPARGSSLNEVDSFKAEVQNAIQSFSVPEKQILSEKSGQPDLYGPVVYLLQCFEEYAIRFSILTWPIPIEKVQLFRDLFGPLDAKFTDASKVMSHMQSTLIEPGAWVPGLIERHPTLELFKYYDQSHGTTYAGQLARFLLRLAELFCKCDGNIDEKEEDALHQLRTILKWAENPGAAAF
jgi:hypothetical protein